MQKQERGKSPEEFVEHERRLSGETETIAAERAENTRKAKEYVDAHLDELHAAASDEYQAWGRDAIAKALEGKDFERAREIMLGLQENVEPQARSAKVRETGGETTLERAEAIMGRDFLGPDAVRETFGIDVEVIPAIPFSESALERAKELGQMLVLRVDRAADGQPLTMQKMEVLLRDTVQRAGKGKILYNTDWYKNESFFTTEAPTAGWALVSKDVIPDSTSKNYAQQTDVLADYLRNKVFHGEPVPAEYEAALAEWDAEKADITALVGTYWQEAAKRLEALQITKLTRQSPADVLYDGLTRLQARSERLLEGKHTWTSRRTSDGRLVDVGSADAEGAPVDPWAPVRAYDFLGVSFSRSH